MKFLVGRASQGAVSRESPCKGAVRGPEAAAWPGEYEWFIELDSLEALIAFLDENGGGLGLYSPEATGGYAEIEIFDDDEDE